MRLPRWTPFAVAAALAVTAGGVAAAASGHDRPDTGHGTAGSTVVNVNGHEVDEHAAFGQETAAQARARGDETDDQSDDETDDPTEDPATDDQDTTDDGDGDGGQGHGWAFGHLSPEARKAAIAEMQAAHRDARPEQAQTHGQGQAHGPSDTHGQSGTHGRPEGR